MITAALITAAGDGVRFGGRKQFFDLRPGVRLVDEVVRNCGAAAEWVGLLLPPKTEWDGDPVDFVGSGGASRQETLAAGLAALPDSARYVLIHSASHPLASADLTEAVLKAVIDGADAAVPVWQPADVIKDARGPAVVTVGREGFGLAQMPMAFQRTILDRAFAAGLTAAEESTLVERSGGTVIAVPGEATNVHVVDPLTLAMARAIATMEPVGIPIRP